MVNKQENAKESQQQHKQHVSDIIGNDYKSWKPGDTIILNAGTGTGKSTFCIKTLGEFALQQGEKILYVCNRSKLEDNIAKIVNKNEELQAIIQVTKYQNLEKDPALNKLFSQYKYVILDECHYFYSDATMNRYTEVIYDYVMTNKSSVLIFASATADELFEDIIKARNVPAANVYKMETDYSYVKKLFLYRGDLLITLIHKALHEDKTSKIVVFCSNGDRIMELYNRFGPDLVDVYCSKSLSDKRVTEIKNKNAIRGNSFRKRILLTTSAIDNGIDFKDVRIRHVFTEMTTIDAIVQTLGRKRPISEDDACTYYIRDRTNQELESYKRPVDREVELVINWLNSKKNKTVLADAYPNDRITIDRSKVLWYNPQIEDKCVNKVACAKCLLDQKWYQLAIDEGLYFALKDMLPEDLGWRLERIIITKPNDPFIEALQSFEGRELRREEFDNSIKALFKTEMDKYKVKSHRYGVETLNSFLDERYGEEYKMRFVSRKDNRRKINGKDNPYRGSYCYTLE